MLIDAVLVAVALTLAYALRGLEDKGWIPAHIQQLAHLAPWVVLSQVALFYVFALYRGLLRYAGIIELRVIVVAVSMITGALLGLNVLGAWADQHHLLNESAWPFGRVHNGSILIIPHSVIGINWMLTIILVGGFRFSRRIILSMFRRRGHRNVLIVGLTNGEAVARAMLQEDGDGYEPIGFIDPSEEATLAGTKIHGLSVFGGLDQLPRVIDEYGIEEVVVAMSDVSGAQIAQVADTCRSLDTRVKTLPSVANVMSGHVSISAIRPVMIEDVLGREPVRMQLSESLNYIRDRCVLVTGAGGSIGSEIVAQILELGPARVVLVGRGENSLFELSARPSIDLRDGRIFTVIADARDRDKINAVFDRHHPQVVFHAAAHKHVPLMEMNPEEAIKNNVFGTRIVAQAAARTGAERFILISTDKAVQPTNVMGASKRLAEMVVWSESETSPTEFAAVRFGNVLGSRGSVVPTLKRQIEQGGPVTITHRDMTRFFMTIPEAANLVIQAGALVSATGTDSTDPQKGRLFVLDMGEPIRIMDLITNLISLSGFEPGKDIEIVEIGPRPGEKIHEELLTADESLKATQFGKIFITAPESVNRDRLTTALEDLEQAAQQADGDAIRNILKQIVPDYLPFVFPHPSA